MYLITLEPDSKLHWKRESIWNVRLYFITLSLVKLSEDIYWLRAISVFGRELVALCPSLNRKKAPVVSLSQFPEEDFRNENVCHELRIYLWLKRGKCRCIFFSNLAKCEIVIHWVWLPPPPSFFFSKDIVSSSFCYIRGRFRS